MSFDNLTTGVVFCYPFLWTSQSDDGETKGRKNRPAVVALRTNDPQGGDRLFLLPITSKEPHRGQLSAEIRHNENVVQASMRICVFGSFWTK